MPEKRNYDVVIIGGGPAGLTAGIYTSRARLSSLLIEKAVIGGQITNAEQVENFPGFMEGIGGMELTQLMHQQATKFGLDTVTAEVTGIEILNPIQWRCPGMEREGLVRDFGDKIAFHGAVDNQQTLAMGSAEDVRKEVLDAFVAKVHIHLVECVCVCV